MPSWPVDLPQKLQAGRSDYFEGFPAIELRTQTAIGPPKTRLLASAGPWPMKGSLAPLTGTQASSFRTFYETTVKFGTLDFTGSLGRIATTQTYMFADRPQITHIGGDIYSVSLSLIVLP